jgi:hypothetical protein
MRQNVRSAIFLMIILSTLCSLGCVRRHVEGDNSTYSPEPWIIAVVGLGAAAFAVTGWFVRRRRRWPGYILLGAGILVLGTTVPGLSLSRALIDPEHIQWSRGLHRFHFRFDDLAGIDHTVKKIPIGRTIEDVHYLDFRRKTGEVTHVQVEPGSDRFLQDAIPEILRRARDRGVRCNESEPE